MLFLVMFSVQSFSQVDNDLVGYWKMDQNSGTTVRDETANGLDGTFIGALSFTQSAAFSGAGNALNFTGGYVNVPHNPAINEMQNSMTIESWIFQTDNVNNTIVDRGNYNFLFEANPNGQPGLGFFNPYGGWSYSASSIPVNQWVHVAMTWDGNTKTLKFYTNGKLTDTFVRPSALFFNNSELNIGRQQPDGCRCNLMNGQIDELRLWKVVRSESEIQAAINVIPDATPPFVDFGSEFTIELDENGRAAVTIDAVGGDEFDDNGDPLIFTFSQTDFDCSDIAASTEVTITVTNAAGISASTVMNAIVEDNLGPTLVTNHVVIQLDSEGNGSYTTEELFSTDSRDNCGGPITLQGGDQTVNRDDVANSPFQVVVKGIDQSGNTTRTRATITVLDYVMDETPPVAIAQDITVELDANGNASITAEQINNGSTDNSGGELTYALSQMDFDCNDVSGSCSASSIEFKGTGIASGANGDNIQNLGLNQLTMEAWVKPNGGTVNSIIRKAGDYDLYIVNNIVYAEVWYEGRASSAQYLYTGPPVPSSGWSHLAFTFDKANNGIGKFYVNGIETVATGIPRSIAPDITLGIGGSTEFGQSFTGLIDDVRIWSTERTSAEINEFKDFCIDANSVGLEAYFKIEANEGTTLTDYSGNGNHLTITGASWSFEGAPIESKGVEVTLTVTDESNNTSSAIANVIVLDNIAPTVLGNNTSVTLTANGTASITVQDVFISGSDNCGPVTYAISQNTFGANDAINSPVTIQLIGTDQSGNVTSVDVQVTVIDLIPVVVTQDITVSLGENGNAIITPEQIDNGSSSVVGLSDLALDITSFDCSNIGIPVTVTLTATSTLGSTATGTATVTVVDDLAPQVEGLMNLSIDLDASGNASIDVADFFGLTSEQLAALNKDYEESQEESGDCDEEDEGGCDDVDEFEVPGIGSASTFFFGTNMVLRDNCGFGSITADKIDFTCVDIGENVVTITVTDVSGNSTEVQALVTVNDVTAPEFLTRESFIIFLDVDGVATVTPDDFNRETVEDNCDLETITFDRTTFNCNEVGFHVINITATDTNGNVTVGQADVEVRDEIAPTVITQNITVDLDANGNASITPSMVDGGTFDNCSFTLSLDIQDFSCAQIGENIVELTAHDQNGVFASANATVTVRDIIAPTVITKDITVELDANGTYTVTPDDINNGTFDNCTFNLSVADNIFDCSTLGEHIVTLTATDASGNTTFTSAVVTVVDNEGPVIVAKDIDVYLDEDGNASITLNDVIESVTDGCGVTSTTIDITSFDCSNLGANTVTLTATDVHGNTNTGIATVTVIDNISPTVITKDITVDLDANGSATIRPFDVLVQEEITDFCSVTNAGGYGMLLYQYVKRYRTRPARRASIFVFTAGGRTFRKNPDGTATVTGTLRDRLDTRDSWSVKLNLKNARDWEEWSALGNTFTGNRTRVGDKYLDWTYYELGEDSRLIGTGRNRGETIPLVNRGGFQIGEGANGRSSNFGIGGQFRYTTRRGRRSSGGFNFDLENCISSTKEQSGPITNDNCIIASASLDITSFDCSNIGDNIVNVTVKDGSGNATTALATVTVRDVTNPVARTRNITVTLGVDGTVTIDPKLLDAGSTDNCGIVSYSLSKDTFTCRDIQYQSYSRRGQSVALTVTDATGNSSRTVASVYVTERQAPVISTEPITLVVYGRRRAQASRREISKRVTDNCGVQRLYHQRGWFSRSNAGLNNLWVVAIDNSGNRTNGFVKVNVVDITKYGRVVPLCYRGRPIWARDSQVQRWLNRGASLGTCPTDIPMAVDETNLNQQIAEPEPVDEPIIELGAYPNPSQGMTNITFSSNVAGPAQMIVVSTSGARMTTLFDGDIAAHQNVKVSYNTNDLPSGMYIIRLVTAGEIRSLKLIVKK